MRGELEAALAALKLFSPDASVRAEADRRRCKEQADEAQLPLIEKAAAAETDAGAEGAARRCCAPRVLIAVDRQGQAPGRRARLLADSDAAPPPSAAARAPGRRRPSRGARPRCSASLDAVESRLAWGERLGVLFTGISLGSILLLVALGLAITYGLMGVINMAHGELMMIGAYATYVVQNLFRSLLAGRLRLVPGGRDPGRLPRRRRWSARCSSAA